MIHELFSAFGRRPANKSRKVRRGGAPCRASAASSRRRLSLESLEQRVVLNADPTLIPTQDLFVATNNAAPLPIPFIARFTDVWEADFQFHQATIDWGDGSAVEAAQVEANYAGVDVGEVLSGRIGGAHNYTAPGVYDVTVDLTDGLGGSAESTLQIAAYSAVGFSTLNGTGAGAVDEGSTYTMSLAADFGANEVVSYSINWGDGVQTGVSGDTTSIDHVYADDEVLVTTFPEGGSAPGRTIAS